jgi:Lon protease-like protein
MEIPLFPLPNLVLFPHVLVPLHIFEERYRLMINNCIEQDEVFGLILLRSGAETESEDTIHRVGVTARVVQAERLENGRMNILVEGESRFRIRRFMGQEPFWKGTVDLFDDIDSPHSVESLYDQVAELYRKVEELGAKLSSSEEPDAALPESAVDLSYMVSYILEIESEEKQKLLEMTSTADRLRALIAHLSDAIAKLEQQIALKNVITRVRGNGDLGKPGNSGTDA